MSAMLQYKLILTYGFAIFVMFFGSGNLVFPISIGYQSGSSWIAGFVGLFFTGILLPFLGLFVIKLHKGSYYSFFGEAGRIAKFIMPLFTISLLGSFGVVPRCITVAHGGISYLAPEVSLFSYALVSSIISYFFCLKDKIMVKVLGKWMSPMLLLVLLVLIGFGVVGAGGAASGASNNDAFVEGFLTGYQTMDLFAALWFSSLIFGQIHSALKSGKDDKEILSFAIKSSVVGSSLLCLVYFGLVYLGAHYAEILEGVSPERMLPAIVNNVMGDFATIFLAVVMVLSCLTTAVALNNIYARYLCELFRFSENRFPQVLFVTTAVSFVISLLNFKSIAAFLAPALDVSYPGLIALTILSTITRKHKPLKIAVFWGITLATAVYLLV